MREIIGQSNFERTLHRRPRRGRSAARQRADPADPRQLRQPASSSRKLAMQTGRSAGPGDRGLPRCAGRHGRQGAARSTRRRPTSTRSRSAPRARRSRSSRQAEAYKRAKIALATGDAQRFISVYDQYRVKPKEITERRLYLETMEHILRDMNKVLVDTSSGAGAVPYLPLDQLIRRTAARARAVAGSQPIRWGRRNEQVASRSSESSWRPSSASSRFSRRSSPSTRPNRRWCCNSVSLSTRFASRVSTSRSRSCNLFDVRQARAEPRCRATGSARPRSEANRRRHLRQIPHRRSAAVLSVDPYRRGAERTSSASSCSNLLLGILAGVEMSRVLTAERADLMRQITGRGRRADTAIRDRRDRCAHEARRPADREQRGDLQPHADPARAGSGRHPRRKASATRRRCVPKPTSSR